MDSFDYIMTLVSIILGLAITTLLQGIVRALRPSTDTKPGLVHSLWVAASLVLLVGVWVTRWRAADHTGWTSFEILAFLYVPIIQCALSELIFPPAGQTVGLTEYFYSIRRRYFALVALSSIGMAVGPTIFFDDTIAYSVLWVLPFFGVLAWTSRPAIQLLGALAGFAASVSVLFTAGTI